MWITHFLKVIQFLFEIKWNRKFNMPQGSISLKEHILIMALALRARFSVYISVTF